MEEAFPVVQEGRGNRSAFCACLLGHGSHGQNLGRTQEAAQYINLAMEHVDRMTRRERYRFRGQYYMKHGRLSKSASTSTPS